MKLLSCLKCGDIFNLAMHHKTCRCGDTAGHYLKDRVKAVYMGDHALPLEFANNTYRMAVIDQPNLKFDAPGAVFRAFTIPFNAPTFKKVTQLIYRRIPSADRPGPVSLEAELRIPTLTT